MRKTTKTTSQSLTIKELHKSLGEHFEKQSKTIDKRFEEQNKAFDVRLEKQSASIDKRFEEQSKTFDERFEKQNKAFDKRSEEQTKTILEAVDFSLRRMNNQLNETRAELKTDIANIQVVIDGYVKAQEDFKQEFVIMREEVKQMKRVLKEKLGVEIRAF